MAVNKKEFADRLAANSGITKGLAFWVVGIFWETVLEFIAEGDTVNVYGFGKFDMKTIKEFEARNPKTGEPHVVSEHKKVRFRPSETLAKKIEDIC